MRTWRTLRIGTSRTPWTIVAGFVAAVACGSYGMSLPKSAQASVSIAIAYETLIQNTDSVGVMTPVEQYSAWEDKKIYTFTRLHVDESIAGKLGTGAETWVVTLGGIVGDIGQHVDGEAVLHVGEPSLLFLRTDPKSPGLYIVTARGQGQFHIKTEAAKMRRLYLSNGIGAVLPPKEMKATGGASGGVDGLKPASIPAGAKSVLLAHDIIAGRTVEEVSRDVAATWRRLHAQ